MTTQTRKTPRQFGEEVERLQQEGRWTPNEFRRLSAEITAQYGPYSGLRDALAALADPQWREQVISEVWTSGVG